MQKNRIIRIISDIILFAAVANGWWPLAVLIGLGGSWYYPRFIELIIAGVAYDALFGMIKGTGARGWIGTLTAIVLYTIILLVKKIIRR